MARSAARWPETDPALSYKNALIPVLETLREMLGADALFLWLLYDERARADEHRRHRIHENEKRRLCEAFYRLLEEKQRGILCTLMGGKARTPEDMEKYLKGRYSILKFVEAVTSEKDFKPIEFGYGEEKRPRKYVVLDDEVVEDIPEDGKITESELSKRGYVKLEGITAHHTRTKESGLYTRTDLADRLGNVSLGLNHHRINIQRTTGGPPVDRCERLCILPIMYQDETRRERVIGVLKAEIYTPDVPFDAARIDKVRTVLPYLAEFIIKSRIGVQALTYSALCKGGNLLDALIDVSGKEDDLDIRDLLDRTTHLFHVFHRGTFIGWSEIAGRINHYVEEITPILKLRDTDLLGRFEKFQRYDELLLEDINQYREHFIHQFHTFVLGLILILQIGIDNFVTWTNDQLEARRTLTGEPFRKLDKRSVLRIWYLTSFYHDYAYILQKFDEGMAGFVKNVLQLKNFAVRNDWSQIFLDQPVAEAKPENGAVRRFSQHLVNMASYFVCKDSKGRGTVAMRTSIAKLVDQIWNGILSRQDHGPLSALVLLDSVLREKDVKLNNRHEAHMAALAIACHHEGVFRNVAVVGGEPFLTLEGFPFLFLLVYCDTAQEWGRRKKEESGQREYASPWLDSICITEGTVKEVATNICYDEDDLNVVPTQELLKSQAAEKEQSFKTRGYQFVINYSLVMRESDGMSVGGSDRAPGAPETDGDRVAAPGPSERRDEARRPIASIRFECVGQGSPASSGEPVAPARESPGSKEKLALPTYTRRHK